MISVVIFYFVGLWIVFYSSVMKRTTNGTAKRTLTGPHWIGCSQLISYVLLILSTLNSHTHTQKIFIHSRHNNLSTQHICIFIYIIKLSHVLSHFNAKYSIRYAFGILDHRSTSFYCIVSMRVFSLFHLMIAIVCVLHTRF